MKWTDIKAVNESEVYKGAELAGRIERTAHGAVFTYDPAWRAAHPDQALAFGLPSGQERHEVRGVNLHPFFAGLLPEGIRMRALARRLKSSEDDLLSLLIAAGPDCIGDVAVVPPGTRELFASPSVDLRGLDAVSFRELFERVISYPGAGGPADESSLPGVQDKISAAMLSVPLHGHKGSGAFLLKLGPKDLERLVENEAFFMRMARACGLEVASARVVADRDGRAGLLVERFDRLPDRTSGGWAKIHQEDACQFLDRYPADKYRLTCAQVAEGIARLSGAPQVELLRFLQLAAFSYLIVNGDLHARNVSLRVEPGSGRVELSPASDLVSTLPYGDDHMALKLDGRDLRLERTHFVAFGERHGVRGPAVEAMLDRLCERARDWPAKVDDIGFSPRRTDQLRRAMEARLKDLGRSRGGP